MNRRSFLGLLAAPAIIRVADLMPIRQIVETTSFTLDIGVADRHVLIVEAPGVRLINLGGTMMNKIGDGLFSIARDKAVGHEMSLQFLDKLEWGKGL